MNYTKLVKSQSWQSHLKYVDIPYTMKPVGGEFAINALRND